MRTSVTWLRRGAIAVAALLLLGFGVGALVRDGESPAVRAAPSREGPETGVPELPGTGLAVRGVAPDAGPDAAALGAPASGASVATALPPLPDRIIRNADVSVEVGEGRFESAWTRAFQVAARFGGQVASSSRGRSGPVPLEDSIRPVPERDGDGVLFGDLVIRVPSERFEAALAELRRLGKVAGEVSSSTDVTQEFVDLESRLRHLRAQEAVLLRLMARARSIEETLLVREQLSQIQLQIEEITGRLRYLRSQTDLATINLHLAEPGAAFAGEGEGPSFREAWRTAREGLERIGTGVMIAALWVAPFALLAFVGVMAVGRFRGRPAPKAQS